MPNAALELAELFDQWKVVPDSTTLATLRAAGGDLEEVSLRAVALYTEVKRHIRALEVAGEPVEDLVLWVPEWWKAVFEPDVSWHAGASAARPRIDVKAIAALRRLGYYLDKSGFRGRAAEPESLAKARTAIMDVLDVLSSLDLGDDVRRYVFTLADEVRTMLDAQAAEVSFDLLRRVTELRGLLDAIADHVEKTKPDSDAPSRLRDAASWLLPRSVQVAVGLDLVLNGVANVMQITQGEH